MYIPEEDMVDVFSDVRAQPQKLAVDAMEDGFEEVSLSWVFCVEELQQLDDKRLVNVLFGESRVQLRALQET